MTILSKPGDALLIICAWCVGFNANDPINANASHGICPSCSDRMFGDWQDDLTRAVRSDVPPAHIHAATDRG